MQTESSMQTDCIGGCEKKVNTEISQALLDATNLSESFGEKNRQLKKEQKPKHY